MAPMTASPLPVHITESGAVLRPEFITLARELAMDIEEEAVILARHNVTPEQFEALKQHPKFKAFYDAYCLEWHSAGNTEARLRVKSAALLEAGIVKFGAMVIGNDTAIDERIEAAKILMKAGGIGEKGNGGGNGERFSIQIQIGNGTTEVVAEEVRPVVEGESAAPPVRQIPEATVGSETVQPNAEGHEYRLPLPANEQVPDEVSQVQPLSEGD